MIQRLFIVRAGLLCGFNEPLGLLGVVRFRFCQHSVRLAETAWAWNTMAKTVAALCAIFLCFLAFSAPASAEDLSYSMGGRTYGPHEYCQWGGGIPKANVEICKRLEPQSRQAEDARAIEAAHWVIVTADNGAQYAINLGSVRTNSGGWTVASVCMEVDHGRCDPMAFRAIWFDCAGRHYIVMADRALSFPQVTPPYSIIGRLSELACDYAETLPNGH